jgi:hypothetical protein
MGQFKNEGDAALALAEECAEVIQVINKKFRFDGDWNEIQPGGNKTRKELLISEMGDIIYQFNRLADQIGVNQIMWSDKHLAEFDEPYHNY